MRTKAEPQADGSYKISGTKIFITGGEHDLTENIIHLVLAKLPDAPAGPKGISLFLVPKFLVNGDGSLGARNTVSCGSIEHKMGIQASATCVMNFDQAEGYLVGEPNKGLAAMFTMMNYERLGVGIQGLASGERSYQNAIEYARDRLQSRAPTGAQRSCVLHLRRHATGHRQVQRRCRRARARRCAGRVADAGRQGLPDGHGPRSEFTKPLAAALTTLDELTEWVLDRARTNPNEIGAASVEYLHAFGYTAYAYMWAMSARAALGKEAQEDFYASKLGTARFYFARLLPRIHSLAASVKAGSESLYLLDASQF
nr:short/branched chain specific acyl-CoA dehydrogenase, mitochondrial [Tanacetum cinerariifolium]